MMHRKQAVELLDSPEIDAAALAHNLRDIARLNWWSGTTAAMLSAIESLIGSRNVCSPLSIVDIGTGAGDLPTILARWSARRRWPVQVFGGDLHQGVLHYASQHATATGWLRFDAMCLPFATRGVDIAVCTQMAHHLEPQALTLMLAEMQRVSRIGFVIVDLERSRAAYAALWLVTRLISRNRLTRHDGPLSIQRAYTRPEIASLATGIAIRPLFPFRWIATWKAI